MAFSAKNRALWRLPLASLIIVTCLFNPSDCDESSAVVKARQKRVVWMKDRRLILPAGTTMTITPRIQIPFLRQPPEGINSDISLSWVFYMFFDKLGMTDDEHPWPPFFPFSDLFLINRQGAPTPAPVKTRLNNRSPRSILSLPPPERMPGGERAIIIPQLEKLLESFGLPGRPCLLRAVCEIHEVPLHEEGFGLFGEFITMIFSISKSKYAESHLPEYLNAELAGASGGCFKYYRSCKKSIFTSMSASKYSKGAQVSQVRDNNHNNHDDNDNSIFD